MTIDFIERSILAANNFQSKLPKFVLEMQGMSSVKNRHLLNNICDFQGCNYLEIGSWLGSTFCSAIFNNYISATCIDVWHKTQEGVKDKSIFLNNINRTTALMFPNIRNNIRIIDEDCFNYKSPLLHFFEDYINVYFYDGDHSEESQFKAFADYNKILKDKFICIIDDWNAENVRSGTNKAFKLLNYNIIKAWCLPGVNGNWEINSDYWWNGLCVALVEKNKPLETSVDDKLESVIVSVNTADLLELTLPENKKHFDNILVVTTEKDQETQKVCKNNKIDYVCTDLFYRNDHQFDRGAAISWAYQFLKYKNFVCNLDVDIILPSDFRNKINNTKLDKNKFYGVPRRFIWTYDEYLDWKNEKIDTKLLTKSSGEGCGFFQIFSLQADCLKNIPLELIYPSGNSTVQTDIEFLYHWFPYPPINPEKLDFEVIHLGPPSIFNYGKENCEIANLRDLKFKELPDLRNHEVFKDCDFYKNK